MSIDELADIEGVGWTVVLYEFSLWNDRRRQQEGFNTFSEALEAWVKEKQELADKL